MNKKGRSMLYFIGIAVAISVFVFLSFLLEGEMLKIIMLVLAFISFIVGFFLYWEFGHTPNLIRKELKRAKTLLDEGSVVELKEIYLKVYKHYLELSLNQKKNFYHRTNNLRETIEEFMQGEKRIEELAKMSGRGPIAVQQQNYEQMHKEFLKLPAKDKQVHYPHLVTMREKLEKGNR